MTTITTTRTKLKTLDLSKEEAAALLALATSRSMSPMEGGEAGEDAVKKLTNYVEKGNA